MNKSHEKRPGPNVRHGTSPVASMHTDKARLPSSSLKISKTGVVHEAPGIGDEEMH